MAFYAQTTDCIDPSFSVVEADLLAADVLVDGLLAVKGIVRTDITALPAIPPLLTQLAVAYASEDAAMKKANTTGTLLQEKSAAYAAQAKRIEPRITHLALGLVPPGASAGSGNGLGSISIGRA